MFRTTFDSNESTLVFHEDAEDGGCIVECPHCHTIFNCKDLEECPECQADLVYPGWAEW